MFLLLNNKEAFYGGAAGGGKSDALLMGALQYVDIPGYSALIIRRRFSDLIKNGAIMARAREWMANTDAVWHDKDKSFTFPSGAILAFGHMDAENDFLQYQGADYQYVGFDELTQFSERQYTYLISRLRRTEAFKESCKRFNADVKLRIRGAANPGGPGHSWVKRRFLEEGASHGRPFIPAGLVDNPYLDREEYREGLMELDPVTRMQLLEGNWDARDSGGKFSGDWFKNKIMREHQLPTMSYTVRYWDLASTEPSSKNSDPDWTAGVKIGLGLDNFAYILDARRMRGNPGDVERFVRCTAEEDGQHVHVGIEQELGGSGKQVTWHYKNNILPEYTVEGVSCAGQGGKEMRANPLASAAFNGEVYTVSAPWNEMLFDELDLFPTEGAHDDLVDAAAGAYSILARRKRGMHIGNGNNVITVGASTEQDAAPLDISRRFIPAHGNLVSRFLR